MIVKLKVLLFYVATSAVLVICNRKVQLSRNSPRSHSGSSLLQSHILDGSRNANNVALLSEFQKAIDQLDYIEQMLTDLAQNMSAQAQSFLRLGESAKDNAAQCEKALLEQGELEGTAAPYCINRISQMSSDEKYSMIDQPWDVQHVNLTVGSWDFTWKKMEWDSDRLIYHETGERVHRTLGEGEWLFKHDYIPGSPDELRIMFVHGGDSTYDALSPKYQGLTTRLAKISGMPLLVRNFLHEPEVPFPRNVRSVLLDLQRCILGHDLPGSSADKPGRCILVADSEGSLVVSQALITLRNPDLRSRMGVPDSLDVSRVAGLAFFSPFLDISCQTRSVMSNCWDPNSRKGDPNNWWCGYYTEHDAFLDCARTELSYFGGVQLLSKVHTKKQIEQEFNKRKAIFESPLMNPLRADLEGFPPMLVVGATGDMYGSDGEDLVRRACKAGVDVQAYIPNGLWHCFYQWSEGCGEHSGKKLTEGLKAYEEFEKFTRKLAAKTSH